jgi:protein ImuB
MVVLDLEGLERLFGSHHEIANLIQDEARARSLPISIGIASNPDTAIHAARGWAGVTIIQTGAEEETLRTLPLDVLTAPPEFLETLNRWGIRTFGDFAKLNPRHVSERLGQPGVHLHKLARGSESRPLLSRQDPLHFAATMELDHEVDSLEPMTFILTRLLEPICMRLRTRGLATFEVHLHLGTNRRVLNLPIPVSNARLLVKLFILDLEAHPPDAPVGKVTVEAKPTKPRVVQNGLFVPLSPEPEKLELTLARIAAVVGEENVGSPEILNTHRPDAFRMQRFNSQAREASGTILATGVSPWKQAREQGQPCRGDTALFRPYGADAYLPSHSTGSRPWRDEYRRYAALRTFRPPREATVEIRNGVPTWIATRGIHGPIDTATGPWLTSGDWWTTQRWDREEWDIRISALACRIFRDLTTGRWFAEGIFD